MWTVTRFFGVDGEMSGADIEEGHKLIQIGVAVDTDANGNPLENMEIFCSLIGWPDADLPWSERAAQVHNIPRDAILAAPPSHVVDAQLAEWLTARGADAQSRQGQAMVGFNVGVFDSPYIKAALPLTYALFTRRYACLNATLFAVSSDSLGGGMPFRGGSPAGFNAWKRFVKNAGRAEVQRIGRPEGEHDAGTDAIIALAGFRAFRQELFEMGEAAQERRKAQRAKRLRKASQ